MTCGAGAGQLRLGSQILPLLTALVAQAPEGSAVKAAGPHLLLSLWLCWKLYLLGLD